MGEVVAEALYPTSGSGIEPVVGFCGDQEHTSLGLGSVLLRVKASDPEEAKFRLVRLLVAEALLEHDERVEDEFVKILYQAVREAAFLGQECSYHSEQELAEEAHERVFDRYQPEAVVPPTGDELASWVESGALERALNRMHREGPGAYEADGLVLIMAGDGSVKVEANRSPELCWWSLGYELQCLLLELWDEYEKDQIPVRGAIGLNPVKFQDGEASSFRLDVQFDGQGYQVRWDRD